MILARLEALLGILASSRCTTHVSTNLYILLHRTKGLEIGHLLGPEYQTFAL
jgi:hypothetical protein